MRDNVLTVHFDRVKPKLFRDNIRPNAPPISGAMTPIKNYLNCKNTVLLTFSL
jgi:hypothetical protein